VWSALWWKKGDAKELLLAEVELLSEEVGA
jgi:hypothetical protein